MTTRADIVAAARSFLDTPYVHMGRTPGIELDCAGVVVCAGRKTGLMPPDYDFEVYGQAADGHMVVGPLARHMGPPVSRADLQPGDVVVLWSDVRAQHMGIVGDYVYGGLSIIHALAGRNNRKRGKVIETRLMLDKFAGAYRMPGVE